jgi:hypothetical protein
VLLKVHPHIYFIVSKLPDSVLKFFLICLKVSELTKNMSVWVNASEFKSQYRSATFLKITTVFSNVNM